MSVGSIDELIMLLESNNSESVNPDPGEVGEMIIVITFGILTAAGIFTNTAMIIILLRLKQTVFVTIILGLSFSDLVSSCISPFVIYEQLRWAQYRLPAFMCGLTSTADIATTMVTVHHVMLLTLIRHRSIVHAFDAHWEVTVKICRGIIASSWVLSFTLLAVPLWIQTKVIPRKYGLLCTMDFKPAMWLQVLSLISLSLGIFVPTVIIIGACLAIVRFLVKRRSATTVSQSCAAKEREEQVLLQLKTIVITFMISYGIEYTSKILIVVLRHNKMTGLVMFLLFVVPNGILRFTELVNPFLYYHVSNDIRYEAQRLKSDLQELLKSSSTSPGTAMANDEGAITITPRSNGVKIAWAETD